VSQDQQVEAELKAALEELYERYNRRELIGSDPVQFLYRYEHPEDKEVVALLAALLAYGRVQQIKRSVGELLDRMGTNPYEFVYEFGRRGRRHLERWRHRFTGEAELSALLGGLRKVLRRWGSLEQLFVEGYESNSPDIVGALQRFRAKLLQMVGEHGERTNRGLRFLLSDPGGSSACKRWHLFLRWMVRCDQIDAGLWRSVEKTKLLVPVDVHMGRLCSMLGLSDREEPSAATAAQITRRMRKIEPLDPVKYDFALSRIGIVGGCVGHKNESCRGCTVAKWCRGRGARNDG